LSVPLHQRGLAELCNLFLQYPYLSCAVRVSGFQFLLPTLQPFERLVLSVPLHQRGLLLLRNAIFQHPYLSCAVRVGGLELFLTALQPVDRF
jgi:hypothetical protein